MVGITKKPLVGMRVVNLALNLPGPAAARRLHELGAEVVKVEPPGGDPMQIYNEQWYREMSAGHIVETIDLKSAEGRREMDGLLSGCDLLITASRPAALARLSLDWETLHRRFSRLCQVAIVGFRSPRENEAGHDLTYQANLGLLAPPHMPRTLLADMAGAEEAISAALALLLARERGDVVGYAEVALAEAAARMAEPLRYGATASGALLGGGLPEYNIYQAREGWVAVAALEPHFKKRLEGELSLQGDACYRQAFLAKSSDEWELWAQERDIPIVAVAAP